nr:fibrinogen alpha-2 chain-like [Leptinotarsa decemlineata]
MTELKEPGTAKASALDGPDLKVEYNNSLSTCSLIIDPSSPRHQWEKWNTLFITSLEPRITSMASTLASIDSNIHNLQERAHVWDTFQLHLSAWNEQLASLDRKMDIISKGQESFLSLDNKMNTILTLEYKLDKVMQTLSQVQDTVSNLETVAQSKSYQIVHDSLLSEFTSRGVLSSIKMVEKKLDRLLLANQNTLIKSKGVDKAKLQIKCNTPRLLEDLLNDVSSKVDVMFDTVTKDKANTQNLDYDSEYLEMSEGSGGVIDLKYQTTGEGSRKAAKKSCNQMNLLEEILNRTIRIENATLVILDTENTHYEKITNRKFHSEILEAIKEKSTDLYSILGSYFSEQRAHFEGIMRRSGRARWENTTPSVNSKVSARTWWNDTTPAVKSTVSAGIHWDDTTPSVNSPISTLTSSAARYQTESLPTEETFESSTPKIYGITAPTNENVTELDYTEELEPSWKPMINQNKSSCQDLTKDENSGVYIFEKHEASEEMFFNKRYCEIRNDGLWTVIQRRDNYNPQHNFNVSWEAYKYGFGNLHQDFWIGNEFLHKFSNDYNLVLRIELGDFDNNMVWAEYDTFFVGSEEEKYKLTVGGYTGNSSDSFSSHTGSYFSTFDRTYDQAPECCPCAVSYGGGWWFNRCFESNLNGIYYRKPNENSYFRGIIWEHWLGNYSLKKTIMMVKPRGRVYTDVSVTQKVERIPYYEDP